MVFPSLTTSRTNRWTIDFWLFVEKPSALTDGLNFIFDNHVGISVYADPNIEADLKSVCFPQEYRDNLNGLRGQSIISLYNNALNTDQDTFVSATMAWGFYRCSVDNFTGQFYLNRKLVKTMITETIYSNVTNFKSFRYFSGRLVDDILIQNAQYAQTRTFVKTMSVWREYIPQGLWGMQYR